MQNYLFRYFVRMLFPFVLTYYDTSDYKICIYFHCNFFILFVDGQNNKQDVCFVSTKHLNQNSNSNGMTVKLQCMIAVP